MSVTVIHVSKRITPYIYITLSLSNMRIICVPFFFSRNILSCLVQMYHVAPMWSTISFVCSSETFVQENATVAIIAVSIVMRRRSTWDIYYHVLVNALALRRWLEVDEWRMKRITVYRVKLSFSAWGQDP